MAAMMAATCLLVAGLHAGEIARASSATPLGAKPRTLSFPSGQCIGNLYLEPKSGPGWDPEYVRLHGEWEYFGAAQGDVLVPEDRKVQLMVQLALSPRESAILRAQNPRAHQMTVADRIRKDPNDLSGLAKLDPNGLFWLSVSSPMYQRAGADPRIFEPIRRLTGLKILTLSSTGVTDEGLEHLRPLRSLKALELTQAGIGSRGLAVLKDLPALEYLSLNMGLTDAGLKQVAQVSSLGWLSIVGGGISGPGLADLANLPRLERLCIHGTSPISDRHIKYLEGLTQLKSLTLWSCCDQLTDASLASIGKLKNLEELYFIRTMPRFTAAGHAQLTQLKHLRKLDLSSQISDAQNMAELPQLESVTPVVFTADNMKILSGVGHLKSLGVNLPLPPNGSIHDLLAASYLGKLTSLEELSFYGSVAGRFVSDEEVACLEPLSRLKELLVGSNHLTDRSLASISKLKRLESLNFSVFENAGISRNGLKQLSGLTNLQTLDIKIHPAIDGASDPGAPGLDLSALTNMKTLTLSGCSLKDADLTSLAGLGRIEWLVLEGDFTEEGLWHLRNLSEVKILIIRGISCTSGEHLDELGGMAKLGDLKLHGRITDTALGRLRGLPSLWSLSVETDEPIRPETLARIRKAIPTLMYIHVSKPPQLSPPETMRNQRHAPASQPRVNRQVQQNRQRRR